MAFFDNNNQQNNNNQGEGSNMLQRMFGIGLNGTGSTMLILVVIILLYIIFGQSTNCTGVTQSTIKRTPLDGVVAEDDNAGYFNENEIWGSENLTDAMHEFYLATGVMPYVYILPDNSEMTTGELQQTADSIYAENFDDEGHFVTAFLSHDTKGYFIAYHIGEEAKKVLDDEAMTIFDDYMRKYYTDGSVPTQSVLPNVYSQTRQTIMTTQTKKTTIMLIVVVVLIGIAYFFYNRKRLSQDPTKPDISSKSNINNQQ